MGNHRFRLSDMMPNAWFYKLRDMSKGSRGQSIPHSMKSRNHHLPKSSSPTTLNPFPQTPPLQLKQAYLPNRPSYYYSTSTREETEHRPPRSPLHSKASDTHFPTEPPRTSTRKVRRKPTKCSTKLVTSSVSAGCSCRAWKSETVPDRSEDFTDDDLRKPIVTDHLDLDGTESSSQSCSCRLTSSATDIIIDMASNKKNSKSSSSQALDHFKDLDEASELELPPILTKPSRKEDQQAIKDDNKIASTEEQSKSTPRRSPPGIHRLRLRTNSPRLVSRRLQAHRARKSSAGMQQRRGLAESFAVVKPSSDPQRDFRDSMVEMIVENNIRASKDLEELLACYLSLNSNEYHDIIIKVFEQIWFDLTDIRL